MSTLKANKYQHVDRTSPSIEINSDGSVSIASTVTYEDVTSVDAVGIVTARSGLRATAGGLVVTAGVTTISGTSTFSDDVTLTNSNHVTQILKAGGSSSDLAIDFKDSSNNLESRIFCASDKGDLRFYTGGANERVRIRSWGDVNIAQNLSVAGIATVGGNVSIADKIIHTGDTNTAIRFPAADTVTVETGGSERIRVDSNGNMALGIAGAVPTNSAYNAACLHISQATNNSSVGAQIHLTTANSGSTASDGTHISQYNNWLYINNQDSGGIQFYANGGERLRIGSTGDFGVGTNSPTARFDVRRGDADGKIAEFHQSTGYGIDIGSSQALAYISSGYNQAWAFKTDAGSGQVERLRLKSDGKLFLHATGATGANNSSTLLSNGNTLNIHGTSSVDGISVVRYSADYGAYGINIGKSNNSTFGTNTLVTQGEELGHVSFYGADGTNFEMAAQITGLVDINGAPTNGTDMPGALSFRTSRDGTASPVESAKIDCRGFFGIGESNPDELLHLSANNTSASSLAFQSAGNTIRLTDTDTDVTSNQPGGTIEWETLDSTAAGVNAYIATANSNTGYSSMHFGTGSASTLTERMRIDQNGKLLLGSTRTQYSNDYYDDITINNSGGSGATGGAGITMISDASSWGAIQFGDDDDDDRAYIKYNHNDDTMRMSAAGADQQIIGSNVIDYFQHNMVMQKFGTVTIADGASKTFTITGLAYGWAKIQLGFYGEGQHCGVEATVGGLMAGGGKYYDNDAQMNTSSGSVNIGLAENNASYVVTVTNNVGNGGSLHGCVKFTGGGVNDGHPSMAVA